MDSNDEGLLLNSGLHPIRITVKAGEVLYIPHMWYHRVTQSCTTIAVNFWYEMKFGFTYVFNELVEDMSNLDITV